MKIAISAATVEQLRAYCDQNGLDHEDRKYKAEVRALVESVTDADEIEIGDEGVTPVARAAASVPAGDPEEMIEIRIDEQDPQFFPGGDQPVFVSHNFVPMFIPRGEWVKVKRKFVGVLKTAITPVYQQAHDEQGMEAGLGSARLTQSYTFQTR